MRRHILIIFKQHEKEEAMEPSCNQLTGSTNKPWVTSLFPLWMLKCSQPAMAPSAWVADLEKENALTRRNALTVKILDGTEGVTEEFIVCLARAVKDAQQEDKCCYHCNSLDQLYLILSHWLGASRTDLHLNQKEGMAPKKGAWDSSNKGEPHQRYLRIGHPRHKTLNTHSLLESQPL